MCVIIRIERYTPTNSLVILIELFLSVPQVTDLVHFAFKSVNVSFIIARFNANAVDVRCDRTSQMAAVDDYRKRGRIDR